MQYLQFDSSTTFTIPQGVSCVRVELWGGGGAGGESDGSKGGGGGGGGAYIQRSGYAVSPGSVYTITVGAGGVISGANGGPTSFASGVGLTVNGGFGGSKNTGGAGGSIMGNPSFIYDESGGNGGTPTKINDSGAAGGSQAGGTSGFGANGSPNVGSIGGAGGGLAGNPRSGGVGGTYRSGSGGNGIAPGGGGGGAGGDRGKNVGLGVPGRVIVHFDEPCVIQTCSRVIDDGVVSGNVIIEFFEDCVWSAPRGLIEFEVLAIGGGGGGGSHSGGGGGGAGTVHAKVEIGTLPSFNYGLKEITPFEIKIGAGGAGSKLDNQKGSNGGNTVFNASGAFSSSSGGIYQISAGGGGGRGSDTRAGGNPSGNGNPGIVSSATNEDNLKVFSRIDGSGGGASHSNNTGGIGLHKNGGDGSIHSGGGGGGATSSGNSGSTSEKGGNGGSGIQYNLFDIRRSRFFSGGGGRGSDANHIALGGSSAGGDGGYNSPGQNGKTPGSGGGGGGHSGDESGGKGASGILFVKYEILKILPVEFLTFDVSYSDKSREAHLYWSIAQEWENSQFEIHRSIFDVQNWKTIGEIEASNYPKEPSKYEFFDKNLPASGGTIFYRVRQVDETGKSFFTVTRAIQVKSVEGSQSWIIYPNPTDGTLFNLELLDSSSFDELGVQAILSNLLGQGEQFSSLNIEQLSQKIGDSLQAKAAGVYMLTINWLGKSESYRIIKKY